MTPGKPLYALMPLVYDDVAPAAGETEMAKLLTWAGRNVDGAVALVLALAVAFLGLLNVVDQFVVESATLLILALLAEVVIRERWQRNRVELEIRDSLVETAAVLTELRRPMDDLAIAGQVVTEARAALAKLSMVQVLNGTDVREALADARAHTDRWHFKGGTGTYLRAVTLPECVENARRRKARLQVRVEIVDPTDEAACRRYADFRTALSSDRPDGTGERWTVDRTRKESFATILAACWYRQHNGLLDIDVRLSPVMTTFRYDLSGRCIVLTQEDPSAPALRIEEGTFYYERWSTELMASLEQARPVPIGSDRQVRLGTRPTVDETRRLFDSVGAPLPRSFTDRDVTDIVQKAIEPRNPYE
jgi:hypothetical protein